MSSNPMVLAVPDSTESGAITVQPESLCSLPIEIIEQIIDALASRISTSQRIHDRTLMACSLTARALVPRSRYHLFHDLLVPRSGKGFLPLIDLCKQQNSTIPIAGFRNLKLNMAARPKGSMKLLLDPSPRNPTTTLANDIFWRVEVLYLDLPNEPSWSNAADLARTGCFANVKELTVKSRYHERQPQAELLAEILSCSSHLRIIILDIVTLSTNPQSVIRSTVLHKLHVKTWFGQPLFWLFKECKITEIVLYPYFSAPGEKFECFGHFLRDLAATCQFRADRCHIHLYVAWIGNRYLATAMASFQLLMESERVGVWLSDVHNRSTRERSIGLTLDEAEAKVGEIQRMTWS